MNNIRIYNIYLCVDHRPGSLKKILKSITVDATHFNIEKSITVLRKKVLSSWNFLVDEILP